MSSNTSIAQAKQFGKFIRTTGGNFDIHTPSGVFEARGVDVEAVANGLINTFTLAVGDYIILPEAVSVMKRVKVEAKKASKGSTGGAGGKSGSGSSSDSEAK